MNIKALKCVYGFVIGHGVVIVKSGLRICGSGAALANAPVQQSKAYFEAKLQSSGGSQYPNLHTIVHDKPRAGPQLVYYKEEFMQNFYSFLLLRLICC